MYLEFFHFARPPFANTADPAFFYPSAAHREALATLRYGIDGRKGLSLLTGAVGSGKTMLLRKLVADHPEYRSLFLTNPWLSPNELFALLVQGWGGEAPSSSGVEPLALLHKMLSDEVTKREDLRFVLLVDEAHLLPEDSLEAVRLLLNLEEPRGKLVQIVLSGQEELAPLLKQHHMRPLLQRVALVEHLRPFDLDDTIGYVQHRLRTAGGDPYLFPRPCLEWIHRASRGVPRLINQICDHALIFAYGRQSRTVERQDVEAALAKLPLGAVFLEPEPVREPPAAAQAASDTGAPSDRPTPSETNGSPEPAVEERPAEEVPSLSPGPSVAALGEPGGQAFADAQKAASGTPGAWAFADVQGVTPGIMGPPSSPSPPAAGSRRPSLSPLLLQVVSVIVALLLGVGLAYWWLERRAVDGGPLSDRAVPSSTNVGRRGDAAPAAPRSEREMGGSGKESALVPGPSGMEVGGSSRAGKTASSLGDLPSSLPLPVATRYKERVVTDAKELLAALSDHFGVDNSTVRDLFTAANPGVAIDRVAPNTRIRLPQLRREEMIVADNRGRFYLYYATLADDQQAAAVKERLAPFGVAVVALPVTLAGQTVSRLYLGPFTAFDEAARVAELVRFTYLPLLERSGS